MSITLKDNTKETTRIVAYRLSSLLEARGEQPTLLLLSGELCFEVLRFVSVKNLPKHLTISVLDERYDGRNSLFMRLTDKLFYKQARDAGVQFIDVRPHSEEDLKKMGERHNQALKNWKEQNPEGLIIALLDIDKQGRIAGIVGKTMKTGEFLGTFEDKQIWAVGYHLLPTQSENLDRVTVTLSFLRHIVDHALVLVKPDSAMAIIEVLHGNKYLSEFPAIILRNMKTVEIYTEVAVT